MTNAIIMSLDKEHLLASPTGAVANIEKLKGVKIRYIDSSDKEWPGVVEAIEEDYLVVKFDIFPKGLGQGQIIEIMDGVD